MTTGGTLSKHHVCGQVPRRNALDFKTRIYFIFFLPPCRGHIVFSGTFFEQNTRLPVYNIRARRNNTSALLYRYPYYIIIQIAYAHDTIILQRTVLYRCLLCARRRRPHDNIISPATGTYRERERDGKLRTLRTHTLRYYNNNIIIKCIEKATAERTAAARIPVPSPNVLSHG